MFNNCNLYLKFRNDEKKNKLNRLVNNPISEKFYLV